MYPWRQRAPPVRRNHSFAWRLSSWLPWFPLQTADQEGRELAQRDLAVVEWVGGDPARTSPQFPRRQEGEPSLLRLSPRLFVPLSEEFASLLAGTFCLYVLDCL